MACGRAAGAVDRRELEAARQLLAGRETNATRRIGRISRIVCRLQEAAPNEATLRGLVQ